MVKHPAHYIEGRKYEPKDVVRDWGLSWELGNALKYIARAGRKDDIIQDLKKAQEYIQFEIDAIEAERKETWPQPKKPLEKEAKKNTPDPEIGCGVITLRVPEGADPEELIAEFINMIYGVL